MTSMAVTRRVGVVGQETGLPIPLTNATYAEPGSVRSNNMVGGHHGLVRHSKARFLFEIRGKPQAC